MVIQGAVNCSRGKHKHLPDEAGQLGTAGIGEMLRQAYTCC